MDQPDNTHPDASLIKDLGGPAKLAETLGYDKAAGGVQRVQNWTTRGIPAAVKVQHPDLFLGRQVVAEVAPKGVAVATAGQGS